MKFRQRIAWLTVAAFLACTIGLVHYTFEISESFNALALDHIERYHSDNAEQAHNSQHYSSFGGIFSSINHLTDIPLIVWFFILVLPYLQVFCMLLACTKQEPRLSFAFVWPVFVYQKSAVYICRRRRSPHHVPWSKTVTNGHHILDT